MTLTGCLERELKPLNPCLVSGVVAEVKASSIEKVDLLFMVDNSNSMKDEQTSLSEEFPELIRVLATGDRDNDGTPEFTPVKDLHLGVVSSDLGLPGIVSPTESCVDAGDDGRLQGKSALSVMGCSQSMFSPPYLTFNLAQGGDPNQLATDFECIATLGIEGCGFEQQLESALKAVWPGNDQSRLFFGPGGALTPGNSGPGFANGDFIRDDSLIAIVLVTDEEDCSSRSLEHFEEANGGPNLNIRCFEQTQLANNNLFDVQSYIDAFKALRPGQENLVIFAGIVGVPERLVKPEVEAGFDRKKREQSDAYFDQILGAPEMQARIDTNGTADVSDDKVVTSCDRGDDAKAYPPRRIVEVAKGFGANGVIQSICQDDFSGAVGAILDVIADKLVNVCLPRPLVRNSDDFVDCDVIWELPTAPIGSAPVRCSDRGFLAPPDGDRAKVSKTGGEVCKVTQLQVIEQTEPAGDGWYYDDFSAKTLEECTRFEKPQRITFSPNAKPPAGVTVKLECLNETQSLPDTRTDVDREVEQPSVGSPCEEEMLRGQLLSGDEACLVLLAEPLNGSVEDRKLFCHDETRVCVQRCATTADCPAAWVCDTRGDSIASAGEAYCVNPTCGGGQD